MKVGFAIGAALVLLPLSLPAQRFNPVIELIEQKKPVFGVYAPRNARNAEQQKTPAQLAQDAARYAHADYLFDGSMEGAWDRAYPTFAEFVNGLAATRTTQKASATRLQNPLVVKMHEIAPDPAKAAEHIAQQLNLGVSGVVLVGVESAEEVRQGIAAMRFKAQGGTRPDDLGSAPAVWGLSDKDYKAKADVWPLNPKGELINWTIIESKEGLAKLDEIAAVKGIGVLVPGAGTLRSVFSTTDANGQRTLDEKAWEAAIQQVLAACKKYNIACGYPATANDIELRMQQGFSVFIIAWGEPGFKAVDIGRKVSGREGK